MRISKKVAVNCGKETAGQSKELSFGGVVRKYGQGLSDVSKLPMFFLSHRSSV